MKTWRVGIDCRLAGTHNTGIGRYVQKLVPKVINQAPDNYRWVLFVKTKKQQLDLSKLINSGKQKQVSFSLTPISHYSLKEQWQMAQVFHQAQLDLLHVPHFNKPLLYTKKTVVTIHDLLWHKQKGRSVTTLPSWLYYVKYVFYKLVVSNTVSSAKSIIVPSEETKTDLVYFYPQTKTKIKVIYEGTDLLAQTKKPKKILPAEYILYVGSLYPHKNIPLVLKALTYDRSLNLVIVSARNIFRQQTETLIKKMKLTHQVTFFDWVDDGELKYLYHQAKILVQPSLNEGFGLTGVEALKEGTPVVASDIKIFHEIYGPLAYYFNPNDALKLVSLLKQSKTKLSQKLKNKTSWLKRFSWNQAALETLAVYEKTLQTKKA